MQAITECTLRGEYLFLLLSQTLGFLPSYRQYENEEMQMFNWLAIIARANAPKYAKFVMTEGNNVCFYIYKTRPNTNNICDFFKTENWCVTFRYKAQTITHDREVQVFCSRNSQFEMETSNERGKIISQGNDVSKRYIITCKDGKSICV